MRRTLLLTAGLALLALAWCDGSRRGHESAEADHYRILRAPIVESLHVLVPMLRVDTVRIRSALSRAESLRIAARAAIATYENAKPADTLSASTGRDTASRDDHITPPAVSPVVGTSTIPRVVAACQDALTSDSAAIATLTVSLDHCGTYGRLQTQRADLAEHELANERRRHRFGFKTGLAFSVPLSVLLFHFLK